MRSSRRPAPHDRDLVLDASADRVGRRSCADQVYCARRTAPYLQWGEPTIALPIGHGTGGRAQQLALELAKRISGQDRIAFVAGSDGQDGPKPADRPAPAGAFVDGTTWLAIRKAGIEPTPGARPLRCRPGARRGRRAVLHAGDRHQPRRHRGGRVIGRELAPQLLRRIAHALDPARVDPRGDRRVGSAMSAMRSRSRSARPRPGWRRASGRCSAGCASRPATIRASCRPAGSASCSRRRGPPRSPSYARELVDRSRRGRGRDRSAAVLDRERRGRAARRRTSPAASS